VAEDDLHKMLSVLSHRRNLQETVVLSTCLRTEVYAVVDRFHDAVDEIYDVLADHSGAPVEELSAHASIRFDDDVTSHLFSVTSGLESVVTGESEVVGQVRRAFERAQEEGTCGPVLSALFRHALQTGKRVRTETAIAQGTTSFAHAAVEVARGRDGAGLAGTRVVVVGAGDMGLGKVRVEVKSAAAMELRFLKPDVRRVEFKVARGAGKRKRCMSQRKCRVARDRVRKMLTGAVHNRRITRGRDAISAHEFRVGERITAVPRPLLHTRGSLAAV